MIFLSIFLFIQRAQWGNLSDSQKKVRIFITGLIVLVILFGIMSFFIFTINNFEECEKAGYPIIEGNPRYCVINNNKVFAEKI